MEPLLPLWLPILLSAAAVWIAYMIFGMALAGGPGWRLPQVVTA
jgi:hypothetical protein